MLLYPEIILALRFLPLAGFRVYFGPVLYNPLNTNDARGQSRWGGSGENMVLFLAVLDARQLKILGDIFGMIFF